MGKRQCILTPIKKSVFAFVSIIFIGLSNNAVAEICNDPLSQPSPPTSTTTSSSTTTTDTTLIEQGKPSNPQANSRGGEISSQHFCNQEPPPPGPTPPSAPIGLTYSISNASTGTVSISWVSASATHYIEESKNSGTWASVGSTPLTLFVLSNRRDGSFKYRVKSCNGGGCSSFSTSTTVLTVDHYKIVGSLEGYSYPGDSKAYAAGWICQKDYNPSITYRVYENTEYYNSQLGEYIPIRTYIGSRTANLASSSTIDSSCRGTGSYRFSYPITLKSSTSPFDSLEIQGVSTQTGVIDRSIYLNSFPVNQAPTISNISNKTINEDNNTGNIGFTIGDRETSTGSLGLYASSSNTTLIPVNNITFGGSGANRTVKVTPVANKSGSATITVTVSDGGLTKSDTFVVTVNAVNDAPTITPFENESTDEDMVISGINFIIADVDNAISSLVVTATSSNQTLVPNTNIAKSISYINGFGMLTITPASNKNGTATITVKVTDPGNLSQTRTFNLNVNAVNDKPSITANTNVDFDEDTSKTISLSDLNISDVDSSSFTLYVYANSNYTVSGTRITPSSNYNGNLSVKMRVKDDYNAYSDYYYATVNVNAVNDAPTVIWQSAIDMSEDTAKTLSISSFAVSDVDNTSWTLHVQNGSNYTRSGNTITPIKDFAGTLTVLVKVYDGTDYSAIYNATVSVTNVPDTPVAVADTVTTLEDNAITINVLANDSDGDGDPLTVIPNMPSNGTLMVNMNQTLVYTPNNNFFGTDSFQYFASDSTGIFGLSNMVTVTINVTAVNDAPTITSIFAQLTDEDVPKSGIGFTIADVDDPINSLVVTAMSNNQTLVPNANITKSVNTTSGVGTLTMTPANNENGEAIITVKVTDTGNLSQTRQFTLKVNAVNDAPVITGVSAPLSTAEETAKTLLIGDFTVNDVDNSSWTLSVQNGTNYTHVGNTITPILNFTGDLTVLVKVYDGTDYSEVYGATVNVTNVNDAPVVTGQYAISTTEETAKTLSISSFTVSDVDNLSWTLQVQNGTNYTHVGNTITPILNFTGDLTVSVKVYDGTDYSEIYNATVNVTNINDAPISNAGVDQTVIEGEYVILTGSGSSDPDGDPIAYLWTPPAGVTLNNNTVVSPTFTAPSVTVNTTYEFSLQVTDDKGLPDPTPDNVIITINNNVRAVHFIHIDLLGSPTATSDEQGNINE